MISYRPRHMVSLSGLILLTFLQALLFNSAASGEDDTLPSRERLLAIEIPESLEAVLADLDSAEWAVREAASKRLLDPVFSSELLMAVVEQRSLSEEARARLLGSLIARKTTAPRGALGIRMRQSVRANPGVLVNSVIPGMPAEGLLKTGDVIYEIGGVRGTPALRVNALVVEVQRKSPGENIRIKLWRALRDENGIHRTGPDGRLLYDSVTVDMALGSMKQFGSNGNLAFSSTVNSVRRRWAEDLIRRFLLPPRRLRMKLINAADDRPSIAARDIELHPDIVWLKGAVEDFPHLDHARAKQLRMKMMMRHGRLQVDVEIPSLEPEERAWFERVLERYESLLPSQDG